MTSALDILSLEVFIVLTSPDKLIVAFGGLLIWVLIVGMIFSIILKKYSFFGYPIHNWPGLGGFLAAFVFVLITLVQSLSGFRPLSDGISVVIATIILLWVYEFAILLKRLLNK